jgi:bifunctional non-homologous end joining protein LigD
MARSVSRSRRQYVLQTDALQLARQAGGKPSRFPGYIEPLLATARDRPPSGDQWVHEIKYDGYRVQLHKGPKGTFVYTRRGYDWSARFPTIVEGAWHLQAEQAVLDGEAVVLTERGDSDFAALESYVSSKSSDRHRHNLVFAAFDLLHIGTLDMRDAPLIDRKRVLKTLLDDSKCPGFLYSEHIEAKASDVLRQACDMELEGIVSKRIDGTYRSGRNDTWAKVTCRQRETFVVAGLAFNGPKFDGIYLGRQERNELVYAGKVERGFSDAQVKHLQEKAKGLHVKQQPFVEKIGKPKAKWLKPTLLADVEFRRRTSGGLLRHPSYKGLREDL